MPPPPADSTRPADTARPADSPRLHGARARAGMQALVERIVSEGHPARLHGHPVASPANRDALVACSIAFATAVIGWTFPAFSPMIGLLAVLAAAAVGFGAWTPWPRRSAWTVIVGKPSPAIRRIRALALDGRRPRPWLSAAAGCAAALSVLVPGHPAAVSAAGLLTALAAYDRDVARKLTLDEAMAWVRGQVAGPDTLVLVSTGASGRGEGVAGVVDWYALAASELQISVDEERAGTAERRLAAQGIGRPRAPEAADVVARDRARG